MVALHTSSQDDVLLCLQGGELRPLHDRVGELVGTLVDHFTRSVLVRVSTGYSLYWLGLVLVRVRVTRTEMIIRWNSAQQLDV